MKKQFKKGERVKLSSNFWSNEFDCQCKNPECKWTIIDTAHVANLQTKRDKWRKSIKITSGFRCAAHNKAVGGASSSRHVAGDATDIVVAGMTPNQVADDCEDFLGLGRYDTFTHLDSREPAKKARWDFRKKR